MQHQDRDLSCMFIVIRGASSERAGSSWPRAFSSFLPTQTLEPSYPPHAGASAGRTRVQVTRTISRELLIEVSILMLGYLEDQVAGGQTHVPRAARGADETLVRDGSLSPLFGVLSRAGLACPSGGKRILRLLTPSEALRQRHQHFRLLYTLANQFGARFVDMSVVTLMEGGFM
ncbi:hypothetical protein EI94DRAFT_1748524 [Lactarius quietus]|nr:hypothetical protein EI94DRAFT_1748524 [Lactarius quietus]